MYKSRQPHILFVLADDYGWNDIGKKYFLVFIFEIVACISYISPYRKFTKSFCMKRSKGTDLGFTILVVRENIFRISDFHNFHTQHMTMAKNLQQNL